ncbi:helix-turn-helix domain-containing protein [Microcella alkaliphila]|uniref:HTH family transcriptional regulator n=1 Tax=Microcella alkaliphila TaxID=279828 RepID=A0A0U4WXS2_9MICO|nr:HTH family transcriptional regulator [Microcella alkaliphila]
MPKTSLNSQPGPYVPGWTFGDKFRKARRISGLDQREFAVKLGLTPSTVAAYEGDRATPRLRDVTPLAKSIQMLTGIEHTWFLEFDAPRGGGTNLHGVTPIRPRTLGTVGPEGFEPPTSTV